MLPYDDPEWQGVPEARRLRFERMVEAIRTRRGGLLRIFTIGEGFIEVSTEAMLRSNSNWPAGRRYADMYEHVLTKLLPELAAQHINKTTRGQYVWCAEHRAKIESWWSKKPQQQRDRWNNPDAVKTNFVKDHKPESGEAPRENPPSLAAKKDAEIVRLQEEVDAKEAEIRRLKRGSDNVCEGRDWAWTDDAETVAAVWLRLYPAKAPQIASKVLELNKSTARKVRRGD